MTRPVWHEFPMDKKTWDIDTQFMLGPAIMVSPILEQGKTTRQVCTYSGQIILSNRSLCHVI